VSFILSDFQPVGDRINSASLPADERAAFARKMGKLLAWSHLRAASWRGSAGVDDLMAYDQRLRKAHAKVLLHAASSAGHVYARAFESFRSLVPEAANSE
jgi:hypothetical protein